MVSIGTDALLALREETRIHHDALEGKLAPSLLGTISTGGYTTLLWRLFGFYQPIEEKIFGVPDINTLPVGIERRRKSPLLARDLLHLGITPAEVGCLPVCERLPKISNATEALGCLYVLEGATLGGQLITRHLKRSLMLDEEAGCAFFYSYGKDVGRMWKSFLEALDVYCSYKGIEVVVLVEAARQTFVSLDEWLFGEGGEGWLTEGS